MPKAPKQKQKLLYIAQYFLENTDEGHAVTTPRLIEYLAANDIKAERKSVYDDIETLREFGFDIVREAGPKGGYFLAGRNFELAEVKLLVDAVQSSKFITTKKSRELIGKLQRLVSRNDAAKLQRQVVVCDRNKTSNEHIYYNVDVIYDAIASDTEVRFQYFEWDEHKKQKLRKNGDFYEVSPWLLTWDDENYYLIAYDGAAGIMKHYRVDKMIHIQMADGRRQGRSSFEKMDIAAFSKKTFGMFAGEEKTVRLRVDKALTGVVVDRFGQDVAMRPLDDSHVLVRVNVAVSAQFYGWLAGLGTRVYIESPREVQQEYHRFIKDISGCYEKNE